MTDLKKAISEVLSKIAEIRSYCKANNLLNSQTYLDFEDELNKISTMDPND